MTVEPTSAEITCEQIAAEAGLDWHTLPLPYMAAIASVLRARGAGVTQYWTNPDDPRSACIELDHALDGDTELHLLWCADQGWFYLPSRDVHGEVYASPELGELNPLALPGDVADAVAALTGRAYAVADPELLTRLQAWHPPAGYMQDPELTEPDDASPELDRSLAAYASHPGYLITLRAAE